MAEANQSKVIVIPTGFGPEDREQIGEDIVRFIRRRTSSGIGINGDLFTGYSSSYEKTGAVDLSLSGNMLADLDVLGHGSGFIRIGFTDSESNDKAAWIQTPTGQKRGKQPRRPFVGISQTDLNRILENYTVDT